MVIIGHFPPKLLSPNIIHQASNNLQTYDEELAFGAQKWAEQCVRGHDCDECRTLPRGYRVGQVRRSTFLQSKALS